MKYTSPLTLAIVLAFTTFAVAQAANTIPQPLPLPNAPAPVGSDMNDSGYTSPYLLNFDWNTADPNADNAFLRQEATRQRLGTNANLTGNLLDQAQRERTLNPQLLPGATAPAGVPVWTNIGPVKSNHIQNGVLRTVTDSGRARVIRPIQPTRIRCTFSPPREACGRPQTSSRTSPLGPPSPIIWSPPRVVL